MDHNGSNKIIIIFRDLDEFHCEINQILKLNVLFNVSGFFPLSAADDTLALLVPVSGDIHVFFFCGWEGDISLGR